MPRKVSIPSKFRNMLRSFDGAPRDCNQLDDSASAASPDDHAIPSSPISQIPTEILLTIFELVTGFKNDNVHLFDQDYSCRIISSRQIQPLGQVCRAWRNTAQMMKFCVSSHPSFTGLMQYEIHSRTTLERCSENDLERFINFMQYQITLHSSQIRSLYIYHEVRRETPRNEQDVRLLDSLRLFLPSLTMLTELACHMFLNVNEFDLLTSTTGHHLKVLDVQFDYQIRRALHMFNRLSGLQDLRISLKHELRLSPPDTVPHLPQLRRLEFSGKRSDLEFLLTWMTGLQDPNLTSLELNGDIELSAALQSFFATCCRNLVHLGLHGSLDEGSFEAFKSIPKLRHLRLGLGVNRNMGMLQSLPISVPVVTFAMSKFSTNWLYFLKSLLVAISYLPEEHVVHTFRIGRRKQFLVPAAATWENYIDRAIEEQQELKAYWKECLGLAEQIENEGKTFVDETSLPLTVFIRTTF